MNGKIIGILFGAGAALSMSVAGCLAQGASSTNAGGESRSDCAPPSTAFRVAHPARIATAQVAMSPPVRDIPPSTAAPPATPREIPLHRIKPWAERCPPPPASGGGS